MPGKILRTPKAKEDLINTADYVAQENVDAALRFLDAAESALCLLADRPDLGTVCRFRAARAAGIRVWSIKGFQTYLIFYRLIDGGIELIRILHGARDLEALFSDSVS